MWRELAIASVLAMALSAWAQVPRQGETDQNQSTAPPSNQAPPRSEPTPAPRGPEDSSSRDADAVPAPEEPDDSVTELHSWNPHQAQKNVEIGDFYYKRENYHAALSRYCEALSYKPNDAMATIRIAEALDKFGDLAGARSYYQAYLKILPRGPFAAQCKKALDRIKAVSQPADTHLASKHGCEPLGKAAKFRPEPLDPDRPVLTRNPTSPPSGKSQ